MAIHGVDHINICTTDLDRCRSFYCGVLGFEEGYRPPFSFPGIWLYANDAPLIHIVVVEKARTGESAVDHVAFAAKGFEDMKARLEGKGLVFESHEVPDNPTRQIFVRDPDDVQVELNFRDGI